MTRAPGGGGYRKNFPRGGRCDITLTHVETRNAGPIDTEIKQLGNQTLFTHTEGLGGLTIPCHDCKIE